MNKEKIKQYLLKHPIDRSKQSPYSDAAKALGVDSEVIRRVWRSLRKAGLVENGTQAFMLGAPSSINLSSTYSQTGETATVTKQTDVEIRNEKQLAAHCEIDLKEWEIVEWKCSYYEGWTRDPKTGETAPQPKYSVYAKMRKRKVEKDLELQKDIILEELFGNSPKVAKFVKKAPEKSKYLYEISIPDLHAGKLAWNEEAGEDYDLNIAKEVYNNAIQGLLDSVDLSTIKRIVLPVGNDMLQVDSRKGETTAGTRVDSDSRYFKVVRTVKELIITNVLALTKIAPVDIIVIPGNHDYESMWMIGEMLSAYFHNNENVTVDNSPKPRKYYKFGNNGFLYTHGNEEKHGDLGLIFATEEPYLWAESTACRIAKLGHLHKNKTTNFVSVNENTGFTVQILPSLSKSDFWHKQRGYMSKQAAKGFMYDENRGLVAEYNYNI